MERLGHIARNCAFFDISTLLCSMSSFFCLLLLLLLSEKQAQESVNKQARKQSYFSITLFFSVYTFNDIHREIATSEAVVSSNEEPN